LTFQVKTLIFVCERIHSTMKNTIPQPTIIRLCSIYELLCNLEKEGVKRVSSTELEERTGVPSHSIRKDISYIGEVGSTGSGYEVARLREHILRNLGFDRERKACIVGLGRIGSAIMQWPLLAEGEFRIVAGFDSNINKVETIKTPIGVFPAYEIPDVVKRMGIELGIIAVPPAAAQEVADRLMEAGVRGIVNFAPVIIKPRSAGCFVRAIDIANELRILSVMMAIASIKI
jgi:redox-sensing transcriptional repressor